MAPKNSLDLKGIISAYPIAEVMLEILQAALSGSLRCEFGDRKAIVYFTDGKATYAVSNERVFRLSEILLARGLVDRSFLIDNRDISNDLQLAERLVDNGAMSQEDIHHTVAKQSESVIASAVAWKDGEWLFSPHSRLRADVAYDIDVRSVLLDHARRTAIDNIELRFINLNEWIELTHIEQNGHRLLPLEAFVLSRLDSVRLTLGQLLALSGQPADLAMRAIYSLWLGGFLVRHGRIAAFSDERISHLKGASLELKKPIVAVPIPKPLPEVTKVEEAVEEIAPDDNIELDLETSLERIASARNYYDVLGIMPSAKVAEVRKAYFRLAKLLHPDRYRNESPEKLQRIENAFTEIAQAHETLKSQESRQGYDIRLRQDERDRESGDSSPGEGSRQHDQAAADFERGMAFQLEGEFEAAVPYFARASYYAPKNARYHAYYGKALSMDEGQRHKAEKELVMAVQLEPENASFRLMLAEFLMRYRLAKRAEGELRRLLEIAPDNKEARALLDSLGAK